MQLLASYFNEPTSDLVLVLVALGGEADPDVYSNRKVHAKLIKADGSHYVVDHGDLTIAVLGDYTEPENWPSEARQRQYRLFRFNIVMDESTSISDAAQSGIRQIVSRFLKRIPVCYEAQIIRFSSSIHVGNAFTNEPEVLEAALAAPRLSGGTAFYDAVQRGILELSQSGDDIPLKFSIAFTDGRDTASQTSSDQFLAGVADLTHRRRIPIFFGGIGGVDEGVLRTAANRSLGLYMKIGSAGEVERLFHRVAEILKKTYVIRVPISTTYRDLIRVDLLHINEYEQETLLQDVPIRSGLIP